VYSGDTGFPSNSAQHLCNIYGQRTSNFQIKAFQDIAGTRQCTPKAFAPPDCQESISKAHLDPPSVSVDVLLHPGYDFHQEREINSQCWFFLRVRHKKELEEAVEMAME
jgi:hypothetical protein